MLFEFLVVTTFHSINHLYLHVPIVELAKIERSRHNCPLQSPFTQEQQSVSGRNRQDGHPRQILTNLQPQTCSNAGMHTSTPQVEPEAVTAMRTLSERNSKRCCQICSISTNCYWFSMPSTAAVIAGVCVCVSHL